MFLLMIGVFLKNSYKLVNKLAIVLLVLLATYVLRSGISNQGIFLESYISDNLSFFIKILIIISTLIILISSQQFIQDVKISKFEYPIILLLSVLGMFFMISSNDLILFYLGLGPNLYHYTFWLQLIKKI